MLLYELKIYGRCYICVRVYINFCLIETAMGFGRKQESQTSKIDSFLLI